MHSPTVSLLSSRVDDLLYNMKRDKIGTGVVENTQLKAFKIFLKILTLISCLGHLSRKVLKKLMWYTPSRKSSVFLTYVLSLCFGCFWMGGG